MHPDVPEFRTLKVSAAGAVGRLTLNRPDKANALSETTLRELAAAARWFDERKEVRVVVVSGSGRVFCAGFDLAEFGRLEASEGGRELVDLGRLMAEAVSNMRAVTIAAIHGAAVGGGLVVAASCDLRLATGSTVFSIPELDLGIPLAWGGIPRLVRELGPALTRELVLTCRPLGAQEAADARFLNRIVADGTHEVEASRWAEELSRKPGRALLITKRDVNTAAEAIASTAGAWADADKAISAATDPEGLAARHRYLSQRRATAR